MGSEMCIRDRWRVALWLLLSPSTTLPFQTTKAAKRVIRVMNGARACNKLSSRFGWVTAFKLHAAMETMVLM